MSMPVIGDLLGSHLQCHSGRRCVSLGAGHRPPLSLYTSGCASELPGRGRHHTFVGTARSGGSHLRPPAGIRAAARQALGLEPVQRLNRSIDDWPRLLGDVVVHSVLDRLMHHGHLLKQEGRSWRVKESADRLARSTVRNRPVSRCGPQVGDLDSAAGG
jgi:hypothetical protein